MKQITKELSKVISKESLKVLDTKKNKDFLKLLKELKESGLVKKQEYVLPLVDTIGKSIYSSINRKK